MYNKFVEVFLWEKEKSNILDLLVIENYLN